LRFERLELAEYGELRWRLTISPLCTTAVD